MIIITKWSTLILEGFCLYSCCKDKITRSCSFEDMKAHMKDKNYKIKWNESPNHLYKKGIKRPKWCIKKYGKKERCPEIRCLSDNKCPFFSYTEATEDDNEALQMMWQIKADADIYKDGELDKKKFERWLKIIWKVCHKYTKHKNR